MNVLPLPTLSAAFSAALAPVPSALPSPIDWPQSILDELGHGVLLLGPDQFLMLINRAAQMELGEFSPGSNAAGSPLLMHERQLRARDAKDQQALQDALAAATGRGLQRLLMLGQGTQRISLRVVPLGVDGGHGPYPVMLQLSRRHVCERLSVQWFARYHGLTPAETRVLEMLCNGHTPREIADEAHVGLATIRTQIGSIRVKTGAASIRELVEQVAKLPPMVCRLRH